MEITKEDRAVDQEAEQDGKMIVAKLHYQTAAQYGSVEARQRLIELGEKPVALQQ